MGDPHQLTIQHKHKDLTYLTVGGSGINSKHCSLFHEKPSNQCLSQDLETGCLKLAVLEIFGCPNC